MAALISRGILMGVYFIRAVGTDFVKIGVTDGDPERRRADLQTASPHELRVEACVRGGLSREADLHYLLREVRVRGEWFTLGEEQVAIIAAQLRVLGKREVADLIGVRESQVTHITAGPERRRLSTLPCPCGDGYVVHEDEMRAWMDGAATPAPTEDPELVGR